MRTVCPSRCIPASDKSISFAGYKVELTAQGRAGPDIPVGGDFGLSDLPENPPPPLRLFDLTSIPWLLYKALSSSRYQATHHLPYIQVHYTLINSHHIFHQVLRSTMPIATHSTESKTTAYPAGYAAPRKSSHTNLDPTSTTNLS